MIWLLGDSIFHGFALGRFPQAYSPEEIAAEPMWPLRSPASMMNLLLGEGTAELGGITGLPDPRMIESGQAALHRKLETGQIRPGPDQVVLLDVGHHAETPETHGEQWLSWRRAVTAGQPIDLFICTGFDGLAYREKKGTLIGGAPLSIFAHDERFNGALIEAATAEGEFVGTTRVIDVAGPLEAFQQTAMGLGASAYLKDGIHLNIWGQLCLSATICRAVAPDRRLRPAPVRQLIKQTWPAVTESSPAPDRKSAMALVDAALGIAPAPER
jgi:hypothetical protein